MIGPTNKVKHNSGISRDSEGLPPWIDSVCQYRTRSCQ
jgi:hypothetical protein